MINQSITIIDFNFIGHCLLTTHMYDTHCTVYVEIFARRKFSLILPMHDVSENFFRKFFAHYVSIDPPTTSW